MNIIYIQLNNVIDLQTLLTETLSGLTIALITFVIGRFLFSKYYEKIAFYEKMKNFGFSRFMSNKQFIHELPKNHKNSKEIKIIYVAGYGYLKGNKDILKERIKEGMEVKFLCCAPNSVFLQDIERLEIKKGYRSKDKTIAEEVINLIRDFKNLGVEFRFYSSEYRLPMHLFYDEDDNITGYISLTLPPYKSKTSFVLKAYKSYDEDFVEDSNIVDMMVCHFDSVWNQSLTLEEVLNGKIHKGRKYDEWKEMEAVAKANMKSKADNTDILIEVAAQHPLVDGLYPNDEFTLRLDEAIQKYKNLRNTGINVHIFVPGSIHNDDKISLSLSGKNYLIEHGVLESDIYSDEAIEKYTNGEGIYSSKDECDIAVKIFNDHDYKTIYCICSSGQMMRKMFVYIQKGVYPQMFSVSCEDMFHDYIDEYFDCIPKITANNSYMDLLESKRYRSQRKAK